MLGMLGMSTRRERNRKNVQKLYEKRKGDNIVPTRGDSSPSRGDSSASQQHSGQGPRQRLEQHRSDARRMSAAREYQELGSSQKSGAHPLENPGQKRHDKSSSANLPQNIEMIQELDPTRGRVEDWRNMVVPGGGNSHSYSDIQSQKTMTTERLKRPMNQMDIGDKPPQKKMKIEEAQKILENIEEYMKEEKKNFSTSTTLAQKEQRLERYKAIYDKWKKNTDTVERAIRGQLAKAEKDIQAFRYIRDLKIDRDQTFEDMLHTGISQLPMEESGDMDPLLAKYQNLNKDIEAEENNLQGKSEEGANKARDKITALLSQRENRRSIFTTSYKTMLAECNPAGSQSGPHDTVLSRQADVSSPQVPEGRRHATATELEQWAHRQRTSDNATDYPEHLERAPYTREELDQHVELFVKKLASGEKTGKNSIVKQWREKGKELTGDELKIINEIAVDKRENGKLDAVPGKDRTQVYKSIISAAKLSNPESKAREAAIQAAYRTKPKNKGRKGEYMNMYYQDPKNKERKAEYNKVYYQDPENKERKAEYMKMYRQDPENKERKAEYNRKRKSREAAQTETSQDATPVQHDPFTENPKE
jgi:hypothetical protein